MSSTMTPSGLSKSWTYPSTLPTGESNTGSAYVLYYHAVDLDKSVLGQHLPESVAESTALPVNLSDSQAGILATTFESEELSPAPLSGLTSQISEDLTSSFGLSPPHVAINVATKIAWEFSQHTGPSR